MEGNEIPEESKILVQNLAKYWRITVLEQNDETLDLGGLDDRAASNGEIGESRTVLY
jgi:hypothetical protein